MQNELILTVKLFPTVITHRQDRKIDSLNVTSKNYINIKYYKSNFLTAITVTYA